MINPPHAPTPLPKQVVKGGDHIDLGGGHDIEFVMAPNLHWPDTMFSYDHATSVVFTCDAFGMHYCSEVRRALVVGWRGWAKVSHHSRPQMRM